MRGFLFSLLPKKVFRTIIKTMKKHILLLTLVALTPLSIILPAMAGETGLPVPRFVSLRSEEVNMRTGPGTR